MTSSSELFLEIQQSSTLYVYSRDDRHFKIYQIFYLSSKSITTIQKLTMFDIQKISTDIFSVLFEFQAHVFAFGHDNVVAIDYNLEV